MSTLFPAITPETDTLTTTQSAAPGDYKEIAWDYAANTPIWRFGRPVEVTGAEAVRVWAWKALHTVRARLPVYTFDYGCDAESLIGRPFTAALKQSEAGRLVEDCLLVNPYIKAVSELDTSFAGDRLTISCTIQTTFGEVKTNAEFG